MTSNRPFPRCLQPLFPSEVKCEIFHLKTSFHSVANKTHFHIKGFALDLALKQRQNATRKWPIENCSISYCILLTVDSLCSLQGWPLVQCPTLNFIYFDTLPGEEKTRVEAIEAFDEFEVN